MSTGDGQTIPFTVEALLARKSEAFAKMLTVPDELVGGLLSRWEGVTVKTVVPSWQGAGFQLHLSKKTHLGPKRKRTQDMGSLCVSCSWKLKQEHVVVCSSDDTALHIEESLHVLKGLSLLSSQLEPEGVLLLEWKNNLWLEIQPDGWSISEDYSLDFGWDDEQLLLYYRFGGSFVAREQRDYNENYDINDV